MDSLEENVSLNDFFDEVSHVQLLKNELNELFENRYQELIHEFDLYELLSTIDTIAVHFDDQQITNHLHEIRHIMSLLYAYNCTKRLAYIPCPIIVQEVIKNVQKILAILQSYMEHGETITLEEPDYFRFPEETEVDSKYTIHLSMTCNFIEAVNDSLRKFAEKIAHEANQITSKF